MRSFLTMLGIIIGVAAVIILVGLVNGQMSYMTESFSGMGTNQDNGKPGKSEHQIGIGRSDV